MDVAHEGQALAAALNHSTLNMANALGAWLGGVVLERTGSYDLMWRLDLSLAAVAAAVSLAVRERPIEAGPAGSQGIAPALRRESRAAAS